MCTTTESDYFLQKCLFLEKCDFLWEGFYTLTVLNSYKNFNFLEYVNFYVLIFIKVFHLLENCYFDSKYHFVQWYFGQECHFPRKIYVTLGINSLEIFSTFLRKVLIQLSILGKMTICFWSINFFVKCVSLVKAKILQKHQFWRIFSFL